MKTIIAAVVMAAAGAAVAPAGLAYEVDEIGSFHIGGAQVTLSGLPEREIVFTPGAPPLKVNPNGDFEAGQMYVQYVKLQSPRARYPLLLWHGGGLTGGDVDDGGRLEGPDGGDDGGGAGARAGDEAFRGHLGDRGILGFVHDVRA